MMEWFGALSGGLADSVQTNPKQWAAGVAIVVAANVFLKYFSKEKIDCGLQAVQAFFDGLVEKVGDVVTTPAEVLGCQASRLLRKTFGKKAEKKLENGLIATLVVVLKDLLAIIQSFLNRVMGQFVKAVDRFHKGMLKENGNGIQAKKP